MYTEYADQGENTVNLSLRFAQILRRKRPDETCYGRAVGEHISLRSEHGWTFSAILKRSGVRPTGAAPLEAPLS